MDGISVSVVSRTMIDHGTDSPGSPGTLMELLLPAGDGVEGGVELSSHVGQPLTLPPGEVGESRGDWLNPSLG
jgi:hypothetical protein